MTERRAILNRLATLEEEYREHLNRMDRERLAAEAKQAVIDGLRSMLVQTARTKSKSAPTPVDKECSDGN